jgi:hypothetical protein
MKEWRGAGPFLQIREGPSRAPHTPRSTMNLLRGGMKGRQRAPS